MQKIRLLGILTLAVVVGLSVVAVQTVFGGEPAHPELKLVIENGASVPCDLDGNDKIGTDGTLWYVDLNNNDQRDTNEPTICLTTHIP